MIYILTLFTDPANSSHSKRLLSLLGPRVSFLKSIVFCSLIDLTLFRTEQETWPWIDWIGIDRYWTFFDLTIMSSKVLWFDDYFQSAHVLEMEHRSNSARPIQERETLYRLIVGWGVLFNTVSQSPYRQLRYDGYETAAQAVGGVIASYPMVAPSSRLSHLVQLGAKTEGEGSLHAHVHLPHMYVHVHDSYI